MLQLMNIRPHKILVIQRYQQEFWDTRLKSGFEDHWAKANLPLKYLLSERNRYVSLMFNKKSKKFVKELTEKNDKEYATTMAAYCSKGAWNGNAVTYSIAWKKVHRVTPALADALAQLFGVSCMIALYGPQNDGNIDVTSINGMVPELVSKAKSMDDFDPKRMVEMKKIFMTILQTFSVKAVCQSRVYDEKVEDEEAGDKEESGLSTATNPSLVSPNLALLTPVTVTSPMPTTTTPVINNANAPAMLPVAAAAASRDSSSMEEEDSRTPGEAPNLPATPSPTSNDTPISSDVANSQAGLQLTHPNPTITTPTSASGFIFPDINPGVTTNGTNGGGLRLWDELHGDLQAGWGGRRASVSWFDNTQNFNQQQSFAFQQNQFPQPFYPQSTSLLCQPSFPQQAQSSFDHQQHFAYLQQTLAELDFHQQPASMPQQANPTPLPIDRALASATLAHNVPAGHSSSLPPSSSPLPLSSNVPASSATIPIIPPALPATDQIPEKENDPSIQPKKR
ncbi:hypothetical protein Moror_2268 [Moniliophthora roreri MCA 2997]|uniref:Uncharacterized protein n=1 Tax=Moniliophthora roreri (strain MCA 2997) TaxID=1381753 RepID=V2XP12_MONRO|nr:hypothetical protein Moror_2268 [Moniliophthora roreri MCA 2997]